MATGGYDRSVDSRVTCSICLEPYRGRQPKLLPCSHTFCLPCLTQIADKEKRRLIQASSEAETEITITCPTCRTPIPLPPAGVSGLNTNVYVDDDSGGQSEPRLLLCDLCEEGHQAKLTCATCLIYFDTRCRRIHDKLCKSGQVSEITLRSSQMPEVRVESEEEEDEENDTAESSSEVAMLKNLLKKLELKENGKNKKKTPKVKNTGSKQAVISSPTGASLAENNEQNKHTENLASVVSQLMNKVTTLENQNALLCRDLTSLHDKHDREMTSLRTAGKKDHDAVASLQKEVGSLRDKNAILCQDNQELRNDLTKLQNDVTKGRDDVKTLETDLANLQSAQSTMQAELAKRQSAQSTMQAELTKRQSAQSTMQAELAKLQSTMQAELTKRQSAQSTMQAELAKLQSSQSSMQTELANLQSSQSTMQAELAKLQSSQSTMQAELTKRQSTQSSMQTGLVNLQSTESSRQAQLFQSHAHAKLAKLHSTQNSMQAELAKLQSTMQAELTKRAELAKLQSTMQAELAKLQSTMQVELAKLQSTQSSMKAELAMYQSVTQTRLQSTQSCMQAELTAVKTDQGKLKSYIATMMSEKNKLQKELGTLQTEQRTQKFDIYTMAKGENKLQKELGKLQSDFSGLQSKQGVMKGVMNKQVAFQARRTGWNNFTLGNDETVICDDVVSSVGGGYDPTTGVFTVPVSGVYGFMFSSAAGSDYIEDDEACESINSYKEYGSCGAGIMLDDKETASMCAYGKGCSTAHTFVHAMSGQKVFIRSYDDSKFVGGWFVTFSGALIHPNL